MRHSRMTAAGRAGFTLTEMLVVLVIIVILAAVVVPLVVTYSDGAAVKDAARSVQAMLAGARDRALATQQPRGVRFLVDDSDPDRVRTLVFVQEQEPLTGTCHVVRSFENPDYDPNDDYRRYLPVPIPDQDDPTNGLVNLVVAGPNTDFSQFDIAAGGPGSGAIRFDAAGTLYTFEYLDPEHLLLTGPYPAQPIYRVGSPIADFTDGKQFDDVLDSDDNMDERDGLNETDGIFFTIERGTIPLEDAEPILLPSGVVVDVSFLTEQVTSGGVVRRRSIAGRGLSTLRMPANLLVQWNTGEPEVPVPYYEVMFAPNGQVIGDQVASSSPALCIWIREQLADVENAFLLDFSGNKVTIGGTDQTRRAVKTTSGPSQHALVIVHGRTGYVATVPPHFVPDPHADNAGFFDAREYYRNVSRGVDSGL